MDGAFAPLLQDMLNSILEGEMEVKLLSYYICLYRSGSDSRILLMECEGMLEIDANGAGLLGSQAFYRVIRGRLYRQEAHRPQRDQQRGHAT
jgi:hypothetical protein